MVAGSVLVALLLTADNLEVEKTVDAPARGSVNGPWAFVDLAFFGASAVPRRSPVDSESPMLVGGDLTLTGGAGFQIADVRFSPTARFSIGPRGYLNSADWERSTPATWSPLALGLAAPDLVNDKNVTRLRVTPVLGVTVPTSPSSFEGTTPLTTISLGGQLERRFGSVELAYRLEGNSAPCVGAPSPMNVGVVGPTVAPCRTSWSLANSLFAEAWFGNFSVALGASWAARWSVRSLAGLCVSADTCIPPTVQTSTRQYLLAQALATWAFSKRFGATLEFSFSSVVGLGTDGKIGATSGLGGALSVWFRTDEILQRNWLDR